MDLTRLTSCVPCGGCALTGLQAVVMDSSRPGFRHQSSLHVSTTSPAMHGDIFTKETATFTSGVLAATPRIDPEVEMLLLSSLQLQLNHAGVAGHPVGASFPVRQWLRQALQGRAQSATRAYLLEVLGQCMPSDQVAVVRRLVECLDEAGTLLSCFAGAAPGVAASGGLPGQGGTNAALEGGVVTAKSLGPA